MDAMQLNSLILMFLIGVVWLGVGGIMRSEMNGVVDAKVKIIHIGGAAFWLAPPLWNVWVMGVLG